jgi:hypothetical protein
MSLAGHYVLKYRKMLPPVSAKHPIEAQVELVNMKSIFSTISMGGCCGLGRILEHGVRAALLNKECV